MKTWKLTPHHKDPAQLVLLGPKDEDFVEALKEAVPYSAREWRPASKSWLVDAEYETAVRDLIDEHSRVDAPSDLVGFEVVDADGYVVGTIKSVAPGRATIERAEPALADAWRTLNRIGDPAPEHDATLLEGLDLVAEELGLTLGIVYAVKYHDGLAVLTTFQTAKPDNPARGGK